MASIFRQNALISPSDSKSTTVPLSRLKKLGLSIASDTHGATAVEYGLLAGLVAIGIAGGVGALSDLVNLLFELIGDETVAVTNTMNSD